MGNEVTFNHKELFYNTIADEWETFINNKETNKRLNIVFDEIFKEINLKGKKFLEVGCGLGYFSSRANNCGAKVTGIDVGNKLIEICKEKVPNAHFIEASAEKLPFKSDSFDIVLSTEVIEHVNDPHKAIQEIVRVAKPGGYIFITTPNLIFKPFFALLNLLNIRRYKGNEKWFFPWTLKKIISKNGTILKERHFNFFYPHPFLDRFENIPLLKYLMINQGYFFKK